jgi:hypothetical protein
MAFEVLESLSLPGDPAKANEDAFATEGDAAVVFDGCTAVSDSLMPGTSDAAWIAQFGARRLMAHMRDGDAPRAALRYALADTEKSFAGLRRRAPKETYEIPFASMMFATARDGSLHVLWFGDCAALIVRPGDRAELLGDAFGRRAGEAGRARLLSDASGLPPAAGLSRAEFLPHLRAARNKVNTHAGGWLFSPDVHAAEHVASRRISAPTDTLVLLATDGFLVLASDYGTYDVAALIVAAREKGLSALGAELRTIEASDAEGRRFPRFKKSDDATALLLRVV